MKFEIIKESVPADILIENTAYEGVKIIADVVANDIEKVCKRKAEIINDISACAERIIIAATYGKSEILEKLEENGACDLSILKGRKESFLITLIDLSKICEGTKKEALLIAGSDKRGTIYGLFEISESCGVTSLEYFGDSKPAVQSDVVIDTQFLNKDRAVKEIEEGVFLSKEPSVEYRGFFINDEWPAFGGWCNEHFGGFTVKAYEKLFIFLLRMRGNFLWPAMWSSIFSEDGPGIENARLADCLGVIMGTSHHEPLCRAGEEWQKIYAEYGESNAWNFTANRDAITRFWRDGLNRNRNFENLITIGMRGEADSKLLGEDATMADNIKVVKDAILAQHSLLKECVNEDLSQIPRVLAIYKEVEDYYYGDETCEGLKDWDELKDVVFLLSDDNWANTRGLPKEEERSHPGGFGMYYHFDYHGGPISYEWQNTSRLSKVREQMTQAYEYGVRKEWIVNVGDLKGNEYPLTYFMALAYDYESWSGIDMIETFVNEWIDRHFHGCVDGKLKEDLLKLMEGAQRWIALRKPEAMNPHVYSPKGFGECERVLEEVEDLIKLLDDLRERIPSECRQAYESLFYYQIKGSLTILTMQLYASLDEYLAGIRSMYANVYARKIEELSVFMGELIREYNEFNGGKWIHMLDSGHTGFNTWDDYDWGYPASIYVNPIHKAKTVLHFAKSDVKSLGAHWQYKTPFRNTEMLSGKCDNVSVYLDSRGDVDFEYEVKTDSEWLKCVNPKGKVSTSVNPRAKIIFLCDKSKLEGKEESLAVIEVKYENNENTSHSMVFESAPVPFSGEDLFFEHEGIISFYADKFSFEKNTDSENGWRVIKYLGREGSAIKCFPVTKDFSKETESPYVRYDVFASGGTYDIEVDVLARNPVVLKDDMLLFVSANGKEKKALNAVKEDFYAGHTCPQWCEGVLDNVRRITSSIELDEGKNSVYIYAGSPNVSFDKIMLFKSGITPVKSYLGAPESYRG